MPPIVETPSARPSLSSSPSPRPTVTPSGPRPADTLLSWAAALAPKLNIPAPALRAYGYAELYLATSRPTCHLAWTTLAGLGRIESDHGREGGKTLGEDGRPNQQILGLPLDGNNGTKAIVDTDRGQLDGDTKWDRAVGPMQFIPSTWKVSGLDGDGDHVADPNNIFDAALTAGDYLCANYRDLSKPEGWSSAVLSYNAVDIYLRDVFAQADAYGKLSKSTP